ncbi:hypothetical protein PybrP1_004280 [[Pythium] brassicae (nom. inval.)]|nr:hypothetical protein PybrP1_004280 [[Pythium] brassicae (nom. inval.)]
MRLLQLRVPTLVVLLAAAHSLASPLESKPADGHARGGGAGRAPPCARRRVLGRDDIRVLTGADADADDAALPGVVTPGDDTPRDGERRLELHSATDLERLESYFKQPMERDLTKLPTKAGIDPVPWPSSYWPIVQDSLNFRPVRRDLGPGFFHLAMANLLGRLNHTFVVAVTAGAQVWKQPARSFEVVEAAEDGPLVATRRADAHTQFTNYEYLLETDAAFRLIGGEWLFGSSQNHPDFLWFPAVGLEYKEVKDLLDASLKGSC